MKGITPGMVLQKSFGSSWLPGERLGPCLVCLEALLRATDAHASRLAK